MSRIGRNPITIPQGVTVAVEGDVVKVKGPLGELNKKIHTKDITVKIENNTVEVMRANEDKATKAFHGLYRMLIANMVQGVKEKFSKTLIVNGVGYKCAVQGKKLVMNIGFSHPVEIIAPEGIEITCPQLTEIVVKGIDKEAVGQIAASIKAKKPVEPYHAYGIRYSDEVVIRKEGKTAGK